MVESPIEGLRWRLIPYSLHLVHYPPDMPVDSRKGSVINLDHMTKFDIRIRIPLYPMAESVTGCIKDPIGSHDKNVGWIGDPI